MGVDFDEDSIEKNWQERGEIVGSFGLLWFRWYLRICCVLPYLTKSTLKSTKFKKKHVELFLVCTQASLVFYEYSPYLYCGIYQAQVV